MEEPTHLIDDEDDDDEDDDMLEDPETLMRLRLYYIEQGLRAEYHHQVASHSDGREEAQRNDRAIMLAENTVFRVDPNTAKMISRQIKIRSAIDSWMWKKTSRSRHLSPIHESREDDEESEEDCTSQTKESDESDEEILSPDNRWPMCSSPRLCLIPGALYSEFMMCFSDTPSWQRMSRGLNLSPVPEREAVDSRPAIATLEEEDESEEDSEEGSKDDCEESSEDESEQDSEEDTIVDLETQDIPTKTQVSEKWDCVENISKTASTSLENAQKEPSEQTRPNVNRKRKREAQSTAVDPMSPKAQTSRPRSIATKIIYVIEAPLERQMTFTRSTIETDDYRDTRHVKGRPECRQTSEILSQMKKGVNQNMLEKILENTEKLIQYNVNMEERMGKLEGIGRKEPNIDDLIVDFKTPAIVTANDQMSEKGDSAENVNKAASPSQENAQKEPSEHAREEKQAEKPLQNASVPQEVDHVETIESDIAIPEVQAGPEQEENTTSHAGQSNIKKVWKRICKVFTKKSKAVCTNEPETSTEKNDRCSFRLRKRKVGPI